MAKKANQNFRQRLSVAWGLAVLLTLGTGHLYGQWQSPSIGGLNPVLPRIPLAQPRPAQGTEEGQQWAPGISAANREPIAGFVESLKGSDTAVELIVGQGRILTLKKPIESEEGVAMIALGNPAVADFTVMPNPRMIRLRGISPGITDISITTAGGQSYVFEVHVVYDLELLHAQLRQVFPEAMIKISQIHEHLVVEGQARSTQQVSQIIKTLQAYLVSVLPPALKSSSKESEDLYDGATPKTSAGANDGATGEGGQEESSAPPSLATEQRAGDTSTKDTLAPQIINLLQVPGVQQVMLQVKIAELDRTALREIGADMLYRGTNGSFGTQISNAAVSLLGLTPTSGTTAFAIFPNTQFDIMLRALRRNSIISIMAEPNLVAMNGQEASFLAGGEFPVPVPQTSGGGSSNTITIEFKDFGTQLNFMPTILDDETIRLRVSPEVSTIDEAIGVAISGYQVPGLQTRRLSTVVELREGETLALAGLLQTEMNAETDRIPLVGDLPYIGTLFSNTSHARLERELLVLVTPHLVSPMRCEQVAPLPGSEINDPNDLEVYLLGRIEGRTGRPHRPTTNWDNPCGLVELMHLESKNVCGPVGLSAVDINR